MPLDLEHYLLLWGPGVLILIVFVYGFIRVANHWIDRMADVRRRQTESASNVARDYVQQLAGASKSVAESLSRLATAVEHRDSRESYEHQEMLIALKALHHNVDELVNQAKESGKPTSGASNQT